MVHTEKSVDAVSTSAVKAQVERQPESCSPSKEFLQAINGGNLDAAKALFDEDPDQAVCTSEVVRLAAMSASVELLEWAHSHTADDYGQAFTHWEMEKVCEKPGHLNILQWLFRHPYEFDKPAMSKSVRMDNVACGDNLPMVQWLHEREFFFSGTAMDAAAQSGYLDIVQWLHENRVEGCSTWAMDSAAAFGHLEEGCADEVVTRAIAARNVQILEWVYEHKRELIDLDAIQDLATMAHQQFVVYMSASLIQAIWCAHLRRMDSDPIESTAEMAVMITRLEAGMRNLTRLAEAQAGDSDGHTVAAVLKAYVDCILSQTDAIPLTPNDTRGVCLLFFDGGSRGNPGPGGTGSIIVRDMVLST
ncbi:hypothetical protein FI667_g8574, partial [Globisporangium splendens]